MTDKLLERLENPISFVVLHSDAMAAITRIKKAEKERDLWKQRAKSMSAWARCYCSIDKICDKCSTENE